MSSRKQHILAWFDRESFVSAIVDLREALITAAVDALGYSAIDAESFADTNVHAYWSHLSQKVDEHRRRGVTPVFELLDLSSYRLRWVPRWLLATGVRRDAAIGQRLLARPAILREIDQLSDREYEALACVVCRFSGARETRLTPSGKEGGVDFLALLDVPGRCHLFSGISGPLRVVGQSKKYSSAADVGVIRDFITTIDNVRKRQPSVEPHIPLWFRTSRGPLVGLLVAHNGLQSGAESMARDHGIVVADSLDLAEISALSRQLAVHDDPGRRAQALTPLVREVQQGSPN